MNFFIKVKFVEYFVVFKDYKYKCLRQVMNILLHILACLGYANLSNDLFIVFVFFPEFSRANIITLKLVCSFELKRKKKKPRLNELMSKLLGQGNDAVSENLQTKGPK